jgi:hypothetical protein
VVDLFVLFFFFFDKKEEEEEEKKTSITIRGLNYSNNNENSVSFSLACS